MKVFKVAGWITIAFVLAGVVFNYPDIQRYIKIESM
jgi:hypothetical protein